MNTLKKILVLPLLIPCLVVLASVLRFAKADDSPAPVNINLDVEGKAATIFNQNIPVPPCTTPNNASSTVNGFCAFAAAGLPTDVTWPSFGGLVNSINGEAGDSSNFWLWFLNGDPAQVGIDSYILKPGDNILWALGREPLKVSLSTLSPKVNATTTVTVLGFNANNFDFEPLAGAKIVGTTLTTGSDGTADIVATSTNPFTISITADGFLPSGQYTVTPQPDSITLIIRDGSTTAFSGSVTLPDAGAPDVLVSPTNSTSTSIAVSPRSVLAVLKSLEASSTAFNITDLSYFKSFNSFLINCIAVPAGNPASDCFNWTDAINGSYPQVGVDQQILNDGDVVNLFFGSPHRTLLSQTSVTAGQPFTATAQQYDLASGSYKALPGVTLGVGTPNPDFSFTELATSTADTNGHAVFTLNTTGTFQVGIKEDFYFPTASITITEATSTPPQPPPSGGGGSSGGGISHSTFNISNALAFISAGQNSDGSFGSDIVTDWTALAFSAADPGNAKSKLHDFLLNAKPDLSSITDYERHSLALEALGINPYSGTSIDYITPITKAFDGTQIGTPADNDDIFALLALEHSGFSSSEDIIKKDVSFLISSEHQDGSWDGIPDLTAAGIQALNPLSGLPGVNDAIAKATAYLKSTELSDGSWTNVDSTSWVQTAINQMIGAHTPSFETESAWTSSSGFFPTDALAKAQGSDGGVQSPNRLWSTSYAVVAASGQGWANLLQSFAKPNTSSNTSGGSVLGDSTSTTPILTKPEATSTPPASTSTTITIPPIQVPLITNPTTPSSDILKPQINIPKPKKQIKPKSQPAVLGVSTIEPPAPIVPQPNPATQHPSQTGFFTKLWQAIKSFFASLF